MKELSNKFENKVKDGIRNTINIDLSFESNNTLNILEIRKRSSNKNKLFYNAHRPYLTECGNYKYNEFVLHCPKYKINWRLECKSHKTLGMIDNVLYELDMVNGCKEDLFCLILEKALLRNYSIDKIKNKIKEKNLTDKVWYGSYEDFINLIIKHKNN